MGNNKVRVSQVLGIVGIITLAFTLSSCAILNAVKKAKKADSLFSQAEVLEHSRSYEAAIDKYKASLKEFRKSGVPRSLRRHIDADFPVLVNYRIIRCCSNLAKSLFLQAENSYQQGDYSEAIEKYKATIKKPERHGVPLPNISRNYSEIIEKYKATIKKPEKSRVLLPNISSDLPTLILINFRIANSYSKLAEQSDDSEILYANAIAHAKEAATSKTDDKHKADAYYLWGELLHKIGELELAVKKFSEFIEYYPKSPFVENASYHTGVFYHKQEKYALSQQAFNRILNKFPSSSFKYEAHYRVAEVFMKMENYERAYQEFTESLRSEIPSFVFREEALYHAAYCLYQLGKYDEACNQYTNFIKRHPKSQYRAGAHFTIGKIYYRDKDYAKALSNYQSALQSTDEKSLKTEIQLATTEAHFALGKVYFGDKDYAKALSNYQSALRNVEKQPLKTKIQLAMVFTYLNQKDAKNAIDTCKRILSIHEMDPLIIPAIDPITEEQLTIARVVQLYLEAENTTFLAGYKGAVAKYNSALTKIQESISTTVGAEYQTELNYILGDLFYKVERFESAEKQLIMVIENFSDSNFVDDAWYAIGDMNYKLQSYTESREAFRKILESFPNSDLRDDAQYFIAKSLLEELDYEGAYLAFDELTIKDFQKYSDLQDDARYHTAYCLNLLRRDEMAIRRYKNFLEYYPKSPYRVEAYFDLGTIYARQQNYENARNNYALAMQHTDDQALLSEIQMAIGHAYYNQGDYKNAIVTHTSLLEKYPESDFIIEAKLGIANSHFRMRTWQEAADAYERVINEHPEATNFTPYCAYQVGEAHYGLATDHSEQDKTELAVKNFHKALEWYQRIIDDFPAENSDNLGEITELLITSLTRMRNDSSVSEELQSLAQLKKGDSYLATEQYGKALAEYNTFVQMFPNSTKSLSVQDRIKWVQESIISKNLRQEKVRTTVEVSIEQQIAQKALASTVLILTTDATGDSMALGSGFFINNDQVVSNWHVVEGATTAYALSVDERTRYKIEGIIAMNPKQDLVILKVSGEGSPLPLGDSNITQIGESIYVTGNPKGWTGTFSIGVISSFQMRYAGKRIQITAPVSPGSSGGPVLNDKGEVIGVVYAVHGGPDAQNLNLAIPVNYLKALLKRVGSPIPLSAR